VELLELRTILRKALAKDLPNGWLFLPKGFDFYSLDQKGLIMEIGENDMTENGQITIPIVVQYNLKETIERDTLFATAQGALTFSSKPSDELLLECFNYYNYYDAFLPEPGFKPSI
jgi:hypothetical protein